MSLGINHAALRVEHGDNLPWSVEKVGEFLRCPPGIFPAAAIIVVAASYPVQCARIQAVAPLLQNRSVIGAVARNLTMAVELPPHDAPAPGSLCTHTGDRPLPAFIRCPP